MAKERKNKPERMEEWKNAVIEPFQGTVRSYEGLKHRLPSGEWIEMELERVDWALCEAPRISP